MRTFLFHAAFLLGSVGAASAETYYEAGLNCRPDIWTVAPASAVRWVDRGYSDDTTLKTASGMSNTDTSAVAQLACPVGWRAASSTSVASASAMRVYYRDRNTSSNGNAGSVHCFSQSMSNNGAYAIGATKYSCSASGGCTSSSSAASFSSAEGVTTYLDVAPVSSIGGAFSAFWMSCVLPAKTETWPSGILGYYTTFTSAPANSQWETAASCKTAQFSSASDITWCSNSAGGFGLCNNEGTTGAVVCPLSWSQTAAGDAATWPSSTNVNYIDNNSGLLPSSSVSCYAVAYEGDYDTWIGASRYSCGTAGGCTGPARLSTGTGYLSVPPPRILSGEYSSYELFCYLPSNPGNPSGIVGYNTLF